MKLSNQLLGFCVQMILTTVFSSPVKYVTQNVPNYKSKCGFDDEEINKKNGNRLKRFTKHGAGLWENKIVTWNFPNLNHPKHEDDLYYIKSSLQESFKIWGEQIKDIAFYESNDLNADIILSFERLEHGDGSSFDGVGGIYGHAYSPSSGLGGDVHFDEDEDWNFNGDENRKQSIDFFSVAIHEIGHALGLGHSEVEGAVMYAWYRKLDHNLHADDLLGIQSFYGISKFSRLNPLTTTSPRPTLKTTQQTQKTTISYDHPSTTARQLLPTKPNKCSIKIDAISFIRREIFIFKALYMWRIPESGSISDEPIEIERLWKGLPKSVTKIDAFYENDKQNQFWMFADENIYVFGQQEKRIALLYTWSLTNLGLPTYVHKVDAIFTWGNDERTFIFAGGNYWRMDKMSLQVENKEPKPMNSMWKNVNQFDTGFRVKEKTYFFKGNNFYEFDEENQTINLDKPQSALEYWMNCPPIPEEKVISSATTVQCLLFRIFTIFILILMF